MRRTLLSIKDGLERLETIQVGGSSLYASLIQCCGAAKAIEEGRRVHRHLLRYGYGGNTFLGNLLIQMYRQCGSMEEARSTFDSMAKKDVVSWNAMVSGYSQAGQGREALDLYQRMDSEGVEPNRVTLLGVLGACGNSQLLAEGRSVHSRIRSSRRESDLSLEAALVTMYARCGSLQEAEKVFDGISRKNVVSWTAMLTAYAQTGHFHKAVELYQRMDVEPNKITFVAVLTAISSLGDLKLGERIHARIAALKIQPDGPLGNALITMYSRCGRIDQARKVFDGIERKDVITWTSMITAYTHSGRARDAVELYSKMDVEPNSVTYVTVLSACSVLGDLDQGRRVHSRVTSLDLRDPALGTALVSMYGNCGGLLDARKVFDGMEEKNIMSWNALLGAYAHFGGKDQAAEALDLFREMELQGVRGNAVTLICLLGWCANVGALKHGRAIHQRARAESLLPDRNLETAVVNMYAKCHRVEEARRVFDSMELRDVVAWTSMIAAYTQEGYHPEAMGLYKSMLRDGEIEPNSVTLAAVLGSCFDLEDGKEIHSRAVATRMIKSELVQNSLLNMYAKCGSLEEASKFFESMDESSRTVVSWNILLTAYTQAGRERQAIDLYKRMVETERVEPDQGAIAAVLAACSSLGDLNQAKELLRHLHSNANLEAMTRKNIVVENAIVNLHAKCGFLDEGSRIFHRMEHKNLVSWTAMIVGFAKHGHAEEAMEMYRRMELDGAEPDDVTFITILVACSHSGLISSGHECFTSMAAEWEIAPRMDHFVCLVDLLGRAGWLDQAQELVETMPFEPEPLAWTTLLGACKIHHDFDRARVLEELVLERTPQECGSSHVLLSNIYVES
ncbi:putative pentatricopeptide repeat-containing protein At1g69350, mitochondrial [Selaginella moellendorffii]|uniref:putative pentatricopeptide repeat-containing protein At1g69350, mitochondrial n=1 Tax=Selaginella moellendorffii TaxID=88036 RepID=UPI000D1CEEE6|nr:putative pentatricopeptide repeat-containing protein At1g69350, mitochondrial [Selaginella moellendorffii]|eukprot:XP_024540366.1 putative pentatricopeptide repeat-containing protein At1g69350, mitochondrial [Selaginella moellendorffii]